MRRLLRLTVLLPHVLIGLTLAKAIQVHPKRFPPTPISAWWAGRLLNIFSVRIHFHGQGMDGPHLQVANHISWLDMFVLATHGHHRYVAKSEVANWPVASTLANAMETVYIKRGRGGAKPVLEATTPLLQQGGAFLFFPEGTTTDGQELRHFHARLFSAASETQCPVQPIAIRYRTPEHLPHIAPFIGDDDVVRHVWRLLGHPGFDVEVFYCEPVTPNAEPEQLAAQSERLIAKVLELPVPREMLPAAA